MQQQSEQQPARHLRPTREMLPGTLTPVAGCGVPWGQTDDTITWLQS